jgi:p-aminobenzoyl-glutamate transporter AbgT
VNKTFIQKTKQTYFFFVPHAFFAGASLAAGFFAGAFVVSAFAILFSLLEENELKSDSMNPKINLHSNYIYFTVSRFE